MSNRVAMNGLFVLALVLMASSAVSVHHSLFTRIQSRGVQLSPDAQFVAYEGRDGTVLHFPATGWGFTVHTWSAGLAELGLDFSGGMLAWREDGAVWAAELEKDGLFSIVQMATDLTDPQQPRVSPDGARVAAVFRAASGHDTLAVFELKSGVELWRAEAVAEGMADTSRDIAWSPDGELLVWLRGVFKNSPQLRVYDTTSGSQLAKVDGASSNWQNSLFFVPKTRVLWTRISNRDYRQTLGPSFRAYDLADPMLPREIAMPDAPFYSGAIISPSGKHVAAIKPGVPGNTYTIWRYEGERFEEIATAAFSGLREWSSAAFSFEDGRLLLARGVGDVESFNIGTGQIALETARFRDRFFRPWQVWLGVACLLWVGVWLCIVMPRMGKDHSGASNHWTSALVIALVLLLLHGLCHVAAMRIATNSPGTNPISTPGVIGAVLAVAGCVMMGVGVIVRRPRVAMLGPVGLMSIGVAFLHACYEANASV